MTLPPIQRSISVSWNQQTAFRHFTAEFASWWPSRTHSVGGERVQQIVFEQHAGGRIYEEHRDGRRFQWGQILLWEPPRRVKFTWHPSKDVSTAQDVEIEFVPEGEGTHLTLTASGWERWGKNAHRARRGYSLGWAYILKVYAGRRTAMMSLVELIMTSQNLIQKFRGSQEAEIARAGGEIPRGGMTS